MSLFQLGGLRLLKVHLFTDLKCHFWPKEGGFKCNSDNVTKYDVFLGRPQGTPWELLGTLLGV